MNNILTPIEEYKPYLPIYSLYDSLPIHIQSLLDYSTPLRKNHDEIRLTISVLTL